MTQERTHQPSSWTSSRQASSASVTLHSPLQTQQDIHTPPSPKETENSAFQQTKFEAFGLQLKQDNGTLTPVEQTTLGVLQAKMDDFWTQRLDQASRFDLDPAAIPAHAPGESIMQPGQRMPPLSFGMVPQVLQRAIASPQTQNREKSLQGDLLAATPRQHQVLPLHPQPAPRAQTSILNPTGLPGHLKTRIERLSGYSMDDVRVHYNSNKPARFGALAYTQGAAIHVAPGEEQHLPHEAWHVVQQMQGRVKPTIHAKEGVSINDDANLEHEAEVMGEKALQKGSLEQSASRPPIHTRLSVQGSSIQRKIPTLAKWRLQSFTASLRSSALKRIDAAVEAWQQAKDDANLDNRLLALGNLSVAIQNWMDTKDRDVRGDVVSVRQASVKALNDEVITEGRKLAVMVNIRDQYGITLHNQAGIDAAKTLYESFVPGKTAPTTKAVEWELEELQDLEKVLSFYGPLLGGRRNVGALGAQSISTISRVNVGLDTGKTILGGKTINRDPHTAAETFTQTVGGRALSNISIYDHAYSPYDFPTARQQMRGTVGHELSHALLERLPAPGGRSMIQYFASQMAFWLDYKGKKPSGVPGAEAPITTYGKTNAQEDLAESMMFFFENPDRLQRRCPQRFRFILDHVVPHLDREKVNAAWQASRSTLPPLAPPVPPLRPGGGVAPPPPPPPGGVAIAARPGGITPVSLAAAVGNLRPAHLRAIAPAPQTFEQIFKTRLRQQRIQATGALDEDDIDE